jgi:hypothetical protein
MDARIAAPPNSGALKVDNAPPNLPNGVRAAPRITARSTSMPPILELLLPVYKNTPSLYPKFSKMRH